MSVRRLLVVSSLAMPFALAASSAYAQSGTPAPATPGLSVIRLGVTFGPAAAPVGVPVQPAMAATGLAHLPDAATLAKQTQAWAAGLQASTPAGTTPIDCAMAKAAPAGPAGLDAKATRPAENPLISAARALPQAACR